MKVYLFDVDDTLQISAGPISIQALVDLRSQGHIVGLNGNWAMVTRLVQGWHEFVSLVGPLAQSKSDFMKEVLRQVPADDYVMVGNIFGISGASDDQGEAQKAGWRFIKESDFAHGAR